MLDRADYVFKETLRDGTQVTLRAVRPDDGPKIRRAFRKLEPDTVYTRFFGFKPNLSDAELERVTGVDFNHDFVLLVTIGAGDEEVVIGSASYFALNRASSGQSAEPALTVEEDYQGRGVGSLLMRHIVHIAREKGLTRLEADVLARNAPMLAVFRRSGLPMTLRREGDVVHVCLSLETAAGSGGRQSSA